MLMSDYLAQVENAHGRRFIDPADTVSGPVRSALELLAVSAGVAAGVASAATSRELVNLYSVARKSEPSSRAIADKINARYGQGRVAENNVGPSMEAIKAALKGMIAEQSANTVSRQVFDQWADTMQQSVDTETKTLRALLNERFDREAEYSREVLQQTCEVLRKSNMEAISAALADMMPTVLHIQKPDMPAPQPFGIVHYALPRIVKALQHGLHVYLHGPAGSGKSTAGMQCAEALGLPFYCVAKVESEYLLLGFRDARGETIRTPFREAYENGGVFLFDEMDGSSAGAIVAMNMALANKVCPFPDKAVPMHENFKCIGAGNTKLSGATRQYQGRNKLDAASVNRFYFIEFGYDEALEMAIAPDKGWCAHVQSIRKAATERGLSDLLITPRATLDGAKGLAMGDTWEQVEEATMFKGLDTDTCNQLRDAASLFA